MGSAAVGKQENILFCCLVVVCIFQCGMCRYDSIDCMKCPSDTLVCGFNNVTYGSLCRLENCPDKNVEFWYGGPCRTPPDPCIIGGNHGPSVCGTDGKTYKNKWDAYCRYAIIQRTGEC